jgi:hypothetical protein
MKGVLSVLRSTRGPQEVHKRSTRGQQEVNNNIQVRAGTERKKRKNNNKKIGRAHV